MSGLGIGPRRLVKYACRTFSANMWSGGGGRRRRRQVTKWLRASIHHVAKLWGAAPAKEPHGDEERGGRRGWGGFTCRLVSHLSQEVDGQRNASSTLQIGPGRSERRICSTILCKRRSEIVCYGKTSQDGVFREVLNDFRVVYCNVIVTMWNNVIGV